MYIFSELVNYIVCHWPFILKESLWLIDKLFVNLGILMKEL